MKTKIKCRCGRTLCLEWEDEEIKQEDCCPMEEDVLEVKQAVLSEVSE
jgi:hypothetical protein